MPAYTNIPAATTLSTNPVSYTHLDVYKRQAQATRKAKLLAKELNVPVVLLSQLNRESENRPAGRPELAPVSYTHLDVYKRQNINYLLHAASYLSNKAFLNEY